VQAYLQEVCDYWEFVYVGGANKRMRLGMYFVRWLLFRMNFMTGSGEGKRGQGMALCVRGTTMQSIVA
jgi:hypothetical protein